MKKEINLINKKSKFEFGFIRILSAGIQLKGSEVKSVRSSMISFSDSYCIFDNGELFLKNLSLTPVSFMYGHEVTRDKKLLLKRKELRKLENDLDKGLTIVPYRIFTNEKGFIKVEVALAKGKKLFDKREKIKERDIDRDTKRNL